jgi:sulfur relay (sulfurtransferase) DsrC/TusE family protein
MDHRALIHKITNIFKHTNINIAFPATNTIYKQLSDKINQNKINSNGIYKLKCNTCNNSYAGQTGISTGIRHKEHIRYIKNTCSNS